MWRFVTGEFFETKFGRRCKFDEVDYLFGGKLAKYECHKISKVVIAASLVDKSVPSIDLFVHFAKY
jgi:hypothetical protein